MRPVVVASFPSSVIRAATRSPPPGRDRARNLCGSGRRLGWEARRLRQGGTELVLLQPTREDLDVMGVNLMSSRRRHQAIETAIRTVTAQLREPGVSELISGLPPGERHKIERPGGHPSTWPRVLPNQHVEEAA